VQFDFLRVEVNPVPDFVVRYSAKLRPLAESSNRRLFTAGENAAFAEPYDVGEAGADLRCCGGVHASAKNQLAGGTVGLPERFHLGRWPFSFASAEPRRISLLGS
jgi:hypothetical protein